MNKTIKKVIAIILLTAVVAFIGAILFALIYAQENEVTVIDASYTIFEIKGTYLEPIKPQTEEITIAKIVKPKPAIKNSYLVNGINAQRNANGVANVNESSILNNKACVRAKYLDDRNQWSHDNWESSFVGVTVSWRGENLARSIEESNINGEPFTLELYDYFVRAWMASDTHRAVMLNKEYDSIGWCVSNEYLVTLYADLL